MWQTQDFVDPDAWNGTIWVESIWLSTGTGASMGDVFFSRSTNKGANFSTRDLSNDPGILFPAIPIDASGILYVFRHDDTAHDIFFRRSLIDGASF